MNTNPKLLVYEGLLKFLRTPLHESQLCLEATKVHKLVTKHSTNISFQSPCVRDLMIEHENIHSHGETYSLARDIALAAFADLSPQMRSDRVQWLIYEYFKLIGDVQILFGRILSIKYFKTTLGGRFADVKVRVSDADLFKRLLTDEVNQGFTSDV